MAYQSAGGETGYDFSCNTMCVLSSIRIMERTLAYKLAYSLMNRLVKYRWKHRYFGFSIELKIADVAARKFKGFK